MANATTFPGDLIVAGDIRVAGAINPPIAKQSILSLAALQSFPVPLTDLRQAAALQTPLTASPSGSDLGLIGGTFGTATPSVRTQDVKTLGASTNRARFLVQLPWEYVAGQNVRIRFKAGMITTVAGTSAFIDCEAYKQQASPTDAIGSDLVTTAQTSINSLVFADIDFVVNAIALSPGDILDVRVSTIVTDAAGATAVIAGITSVKLICDAR